MASNPLTAPSGPSPWGTPGSSVVPAGTPPIRGGANALLRAPAGPPPAPVTGMMQPGVQRSFSPEGLEDRVSTRIPTAKGLQYDPHEMTGNRALTIGHFAMLPEGFHPHHAGAEGFEKGRAQVEGGMRKAAQAIRDRYGFVNTAGLSDPGVLERFIEHGHDNLHFLWNHASQRPWAPLAARWYWAANGMAHRIADSSGGKITTRQAAAALAGLSPSTDWNMNATMAERLAQMHLGEKELKVSPEMLEHMRRAAGARKDAAPLQLRIEGGTRADTGAKVPGIRVGMRLADMEHPLDRALFARAYDETHNPNWRRYDIFSPSGDRVRAMTKAGTPANMKWQSYDNIARAMRVLDKDDLRTISESLGGNHKVRNFYNNIVSPDAGAFMPRFMADFTGDTHHVNATTLHPLGSGHPIVAQAMTGAPAVNVTGSTGLYGLHADAGRRLSGTINRRLGRLEYLPNQVQSVTWEAIRNMFAKQHKRADNHLNPLHEVGQIAHGANYAVRHGFMTPQQGRERVMQAAGGIKDPDWWTGVASDEEE